MGGGTSKGKSSAESSTGIWGAQAGFLKSLFGRAESLYGQGNYQYGQGRVAGLDPQTAMSIGASGEQFQRGQQNIGAASQQTNATLRGEYLGPESNPWLQRTHDVGVRNMTRGFYNATNALGSRMEAAGRTGSGAHAYGSQIAQENLATGIGDFTANLYGNNYQQERGRQMQAVGMAGANTAAGWQNIGALGQSGDRMQAQRQAELSDMVERFQFDQMGSAQKLAEFSQMIGTPIMTQRSTSKSKESSAEGGVT